MGCRKLQYYFSDGAISDHHRDSGTIPNRFVFRFSSEYHDSETGLVYYNYRYYSPDLGRWLNRDPIGERGGWNLYGMLGNRVINYWDRLGYYNPFKEGNALGVHGWLDNLLTAITKADRVADGVRNKLTESDPTITPAPPDTDGSRYADIHKAIFAGDFHATDEVYAVAAYETFYGNYEKCWRYCMKNDNIKLGKGIAMLSYLLGTKVMKKDFGMPVYLGQADTTNLLRLITYGTALAPYVNAIKRSIPFTKYFQPTALWRVAKGGFATLVFVEFGLSMKCMKKCLSCTK